MSRYIACGALGMLEGRLPLFLYAYHSFTPLSFSVLTMILAASKERRPPPPCRRGADPDPADFTFFGRGARLGSADAFRRRPPSPRSASCIV